MLMKKEFIRRHLAFILTISITYVIGAILLIAQYIAADDNTIDFFEMFISSIVPTTITYTLGCVLVNIVEILENRGKNYVYNLIMCVFVFIYVIQYVIYVFAGDSICFGFFEILITFFILIGNIMCYKEKELNRYHNLI